MYRITANADKVTNREHLVIVQFYKDDAPPSFVSEPSVPSFIPCHIKDDNEETKDWIYNLPQAISYKGTKVSFALTCSVDNLFTFIVKSNVMTLRLNTNGGADRAFLNKTADFYTCLIRLSDEDGLQSFSTVAFRKNCELSEKIDTSLS